MSPCHALILCVLVSAAAFVGATRFGRNEARCLAFCGGRNSEECRTCNNRIPMRFGKRSSASRNPYLYNLGAEPNVRLLAIIQGRPDDSDESYNYEN